MILRHYAPYIAFCAKRSFYDDYGNCYEIADEDIRQGEVLRVIRGESRLDVDLLGELMEKVKAEIQGLSLAAEQAKRELDEKLESAAAEQREFDQLRRWADLYDRCSFAAKKMIVSQFVKAVYVHRNYNIEIEFNVSFEAFRALAITGNTV